MSGNTMNKVISTAVFAFGLFVSTTCFAHGGGHGGGGHGGGWHGGYYHGGGWHGGGWHGGYYHGGGWGWGGWGPGVVVGVPGGYYPPDCDTIRVCNAYGHCWLEQSCY